ncbi:MAG: AbrB/MazE/SpoVT family DNA-binding domain-containing protein [Ornithinimicrobium sp.]|jgi:AbrB family looped-hinge helix DNA binding protein|uniref:AbrB/MazE/SpoVT family DNA-binding domain-containing protein n=1 Tax=Ornithinimicrobium sp. TaxID=1977084 RepID=UPI001807A478|nr:AbrB/MazE/SpoVT family DNA-binding domain-containing protein [Actinomycetota bacterium]
MQTTIDKAGRVVIPKALRDEIGLSPGAVEINVVGAALQVQPLTTDQLVERDGFLMLPEGGDPLSTADVRALRLADQR